MPTGKKKRSIWKSKAEYYIFRTVEGAIQLLPPRFADSLGIFLGKIAYYLVPSRRRIVERNFRIAWELQGDELRQATKRCMETCGANLLGGVRCGKMSDTEIAQCVEIVGADILDQALREGKGVIVALAHMGNWEILARIASIVAPGSPAGAFYRPLNNPWMNQMTKRRRQRSGMLLFSSKEGFNQSLPLLRNGGILGILSDQHAGRSGCLTTFFGRPTPCSPLVDLLQRRSDAALLYVSLERVAPAHWRLTLRRHSEHEPINTRSIMAGVEQSLSKSPADGFWLHDRWKQPKMRPLDHHCSRVLLDPGAITRPWRWIIVVSQDSAIAAAAAPAMNFFTRTLNHFQFDIISGHTIAIEGTNVNQHPHHEHIAKQIDQIEGSKPYPLDGIIYFCAPHEGCVIPGASFAAIRITVGKKQYRKATLWLPATGALDQDQTWWDFIAQAGLQLPSP